DSEWFVQTLFSKWYANVRFSSAYGITQHLDPIGTTFDDQDVAIGCSEKEARIAETIGIKVDLETRRYLKPGVCGTSRDTRQINCQAISARRRQIMNRNFAPDTRRIFCPIANGGLARQHCAAFGDSTNFSPGTENR